MKNMIAIIYLLMMLSSIALAQTDTQKIDELITAYASIKEFKGSVLVSKQGKILLEKGYGVRDIQKQTFNDENTVYLTASITKTFTSAMILKLSELKMLSLDDRLSKYFPDYPYADSISIENLLTHTSGVHDYVQNAEFMYNEATKPVDQKTMLSLFKDKKLDFQPGTNWKYSNSGYMLLGYIIEKITKMRYDQAIRTYIFKPLEMENSGFDYAHLNAPSKAIGYYSDSGKDYNKIAPVADSTVLYAAGSIYSTVGDLYKWHEALNSNRLFSKATAEKMYNPNKFHNYGYGWAVDSLYNKRIVSHSGGFWGFRSNLARITDDNVCIILLNNTETPGLDNITKMILAILYKQPYTLPHAKHTVKLHEDQLKKYLGTYLIREPDLEVEIKLEADVLVAYPKQGPRAEMSATDATHFFLKEQEKFEITFEKAQNTNSYIMKITINGKTRTGQKME